MISPLAHIHPNAKIGSNVKIDPFAVVHEDVEIGEGTHIMSHATIMDGSRLGKNCRIFPNAVISGIPQDLKFVGEHTTAEIGDNTTIRESVTVNRGTRAAGKTVVGSNCLLMAYSHVAHDCILGNSVILANSVQLAGHVEVGDFAVLGGLSGAHQFTRIGAHTYIAGSTVIRKDIPPYVKAAREPMSYMGVNIVGLQRCAFDDMVIKRISEIYHILFVEKNTTTHALEVISSTFDTSPERDAILDFIKSSKTGIIRRPSKTSNDEDNVF
ncbi:acyl-ACP--UDP-N-acetylglucosamine O-acyltransferase [Segetibacter sp. 3557_3]|uniref:acyl-ACP--UDP-N-acetylglucosamine O-acyltransferase n=1 Tax=Segetibacter sp. 3557_3 TaxID=2547429 RepID=UPI001058D67C|nr:acyl-ACP--UDP-N-acetylglucosamine O-acyltransferase [Segetibacter sp. 3557_3]TDH19835.1 acyl-ACP--UDP-N-acetylglucosamine O-acyltransferase [Segetibacter sp. 3557_3]